MTMFEIWNVNALIINFSGVEIAAQETEAAAADPAAGAVLRPDRRRLTAGVLADPAQLLRNQTGTNWREMPNNCRRTSTFALVTQYFV